MASEIKMPQFGLTMTEGLIAQWLKKEGEAVKSGEALFVVETDKLSNEVESEVAGILLKIVQPEGAEVPVQGVVAIIGEAGEKAAAPAGGAAAPAVAKPAAPAAPQAVAAAAATSGRVKASPLAKKMAADRGIDLSRLQGSGPGGRIVSKDLAGAPLQAPPPAAASAALAAPLPVTGQPIRRQRLSAMRRAIAKNMSLSWTTAPTVTFNRSADVGALASLKDELSRDGQKISYTDILCKLVTVALQAFPYVNSSIDGNDVIFHDYVNMGVAVALDDGLVVPVIRDTQVKGIAAISKEVKDLAARARSGELNPDELTGGTFTITNLGMFGMESFSPIINQPESAILGVNAITKVPVQKEDGSIAMQSRIGLSLTADHRTVDGAVAAQFLQKVCKMIENPWQMLM